jgi:transposase
MIIFLEPPKTINGARRQTILTSVLESLRLYLKTFTLANVLDELKHWWKTGKSCFTRLLNKLKLKLPDKFVIDRILPKPSG